MIINPMIDEFILRLENSTKQGLNFPLEIKIMLQIVFQTGLTNEFEELIFTSKFVIKTHELINRVGCEAEGYEKLSNEFKSAIEKTKILVKTIVDRGEDDIIENFNKKFLKQNQQLSNDILKLCKDLSVIKNWKLDGNILPYEPSYKLIGDLQGDNEVSSKKLDITFLKDVYRRLKLSAILTTLLFLLFLLLDTPVTAIGWLLALGILGLLMYIVLQIIFLTREQK